MRGLVMLSLLIMLSGCAAVSEVVSGDENKVTVKAGRWANPGPDATAHCAKYGKTAGTPAIASLGAGMGYAFYTFPCE